MGLLYESLYLCVLAKEMKTRILIIIFLICLAPVYTRAQDTIRLDKKVEYHKKDNYQGKDFVSKIKYGRELINISDTVKEVDWCYYLNNKRDCYSKIYTLRGDSILLEDNRYDTIQWIYKKVNDDRFLIYRKMKGVIESGYTKTLIPIKKDGLFTTTTYDGKYVLWLTDYSRSENHPNYIYPQVALKSKIYQAKEVEQAPTRINGDSMNIIKLPRRDACLCEPMYSVHTMSFIVTKEGDIVNIKQEFGNFDMNFCPTYILDLMRSIYSMGPLKPAMKNSKPVNVKWKMKVDMMRSY